MSASAETLPGLAFPILIGDIGGTNARFALLMDENSAPVVFPVVPTGGYPSIQAALETGVLPQAARRPRSAIIAVAAPVKGDEIPLTNAGWVITPADMIATLGLSDVIVLNDFEAQALAVAAIAKTDCAQIGAGEPLESASCAVLGPGTGLGVAGLLHTHATYFPVPGEGGHVDIGPRTPRDTAIWPHLETIEGRISAEQLLCGRGIVNIYQAICRTDGLTPEHTDPAEITAAGLGHTDPGHTDPGHTGKACVETLSLFAGYLGRVAGDMALIFMARGGVYLAGGISQKILPALQQPEFRAAFEDKAPHSALMRSIPTYVVTHPFAALAGLAAFAQTPARFGVATEGRHWKA